MLHVNVCYMLHVTCFVLCIICFFLTYRRCIETDESNHGLADASGDENCVVLPSVSTDHDYGATAQQPADQLAAAQAEIARLNAEVASMREERCFLTRLSKDDELLTFYTGFPSYATFSQVPCVISFKFLGDLQNYTVLETLGPTEPEK